MTTKQGEASGYSLWLMPEKSAGQLCDQIIAQLAEELGLPPFKAHVTIAGGFHGLSEPTMAGLTQHLAALHAPVPILSDGYNTSSEHFRACYMEVRQTTGVLTLRYLAKQRFGLVGEEYYPHLSVAYGAIPTARRQEVLRWLRTTMRGSFWADSISLVHTQGPVEAWREIANYPLTGQ